MKEEEVKKLLITVLPILVIVSMLAMAIPVVAQDVDVEVGVLGDTGGDPPIIKAKWETPDDYPAPNGDPGTQIDPPLAWEIYKPVKYWAVVTDPQGKSNIAAVYVDVFHPAGPPENGSFKYQLQLTVQDKATAIDEFEQAVTDGTIVINEPTYTVEEIREELTQCSADIYMVEGDLYYEQPAGTYTVIIKAVDKQSNVTEFTNYMEYVAAAGIELDFTSISYGTVTVCDNQLVDGDTTWVSPAAAAGVGQTNKATVRNVGNTKVKVTIAGSDLNNGSQDLGKTGEEWNVEYDARIGHALPHQVFYPTEAPITLAQEIDLSSWDKLDLSMHIKKFGTTGTWSGTLTIGSVISPWVP
jgi:hypothetical protein